MRGEILSGACCDFVIVLLDTGSERLLLYGLAFHSKAVVFERL